MGSCVEGEGEEEQESSTSARGKRSTAFFGGGPQRPTVVLEDKRCEEWKGPKASPSALPR